MKFLGINISHHPSICIYENNKVISFYNEERFLLKKNICVDEKTEIYQSILEKINIKIDFVCYSSFGRNYSYMGSNLISDLDNIIIRKIQKQLGNPPYYFNIKEHHLYHALSSFYFSKFKEAAAIVIDGGGSCKFKIPYQEVESIYLIDKKNIIPFYKHSSSYKSYLMFKNKVKEYEFTGYIDGFLNKFSNHCTGGQIFDKACEEIGFKDGNDAGKLMGLSSYADSNKKYSLDYNKVKVAKETQEKTFKSTCNLIDKIKDKTKNILLSGGYFLNCSNNFKYVKKYPKLNFFVDPIPHDAGTAIGAVLYYDNYKK